MKMNNEVIRHGTAISKWLKENANPYVAIVITDEGVRMTSVEDFSPLTEVDKN
ncbi:hypothetical protein [Shouchella patagoniensis]|uniref:hypothetical protein n=1 Tax=Shouchella patagoniensis TaxID=228576 RepID=UPI0014735D2C|nr:hypothetical protein [Shouchella patagoniensis]